MIEVWRRCCGILVAFPGTCPRLDQLHRELDRAVCAAYGWDTAILDDEEEILRRLLALNLERAADEKTPLP